MQNDRKNKKVSTRKIKREQVRSKEKSEKKGEKFEQRGEKKKRMSGLAKKNMRLRV